jgi:hypothetical protein
MAVSLVSTGVTFPDSSTQTTAATGFGFKNRIINSAMVIDQRNAGASVTPGNGQYTLDRFGSICSVGSKYSVRQNAPSLGSVTPPSGFTNYLGVTSLSAYSVGAAEVFSQYQVIEGFNIADLAWGTASAATVTLSFWVRSSLTGTFGGSLQNSGSTRNYPFSYTISAANTWEQKSITIAGDTSGTWLTNNGQGIILTFGLGVGSTYSGTAGAWAAGEKYSATGATSVVGTNGATFYITGVQLEKGSTATSFDYRPYGTELALCQRYYEVIGAGTSGGTRAGNTFVSSIRFLVPKRASPTMSLLATSWSISNATATTITVTSGLLGGAAILTANGTSQEIYGTVTAGTVTSGQAGILLTDNVLGASAEL